MTYSVRPDLLAMTLNLLESYPMQEMRAQDVMDWCKQNHPVGMNVWKQDFAKCLSELVRRNKAVRSTPRGNGERCVWYALKLPENAPTKRRGLKWDAN